MTHRHLTSKRNRKRKLQWALNDSVFSAPKSKRQRLEHTEDKPLKYMFIFTHTLIANYEDIIKDSWTRSLKYVLPRLRRDTKYEELRLSATQYLNELTISLFIEDDLVDHLFRFMGQCQYPCPPLNDSLKYDLMEIKDKFFDDNMHRIQLKPGIRIMLREVRETLKWTLCLIHKDSRETFNLILNDIGLRGYFNAFVCASSISNHCRPYSQLYEQALARSRIFKQQCLILTEHIPEALESIDFGIYPILVSNQHPVMDGEYFRIHRDAKWMDEVQKDHRGDKWMDEVQKLIVSIRDAKDRVGTLQTLKDYNNCFDEGDKVQFLGLDGKSCDGVIDKLFTPFPTKLYRVKYTDSAGNTKTSLKQTYFLWKQEVEPQSNESSISSLS